MPDEVKNAGTKVADQVNGGEGQGGAQGQKGQEGGTPQPNVVTMEFLKGWGDAQARKTAEQITSVAQQMAGLKEEIAKSIESLKQSPAEDSEAKKREKAQTVPELVDLKKRLEEMQRQLQERDKAIAEAKERDRQFRFQTRVKDALNKQGCLKTELAFRMVQPDLKLDENGERVFATVEMEGQPVELDVDKYVETVVKEKLAPEFFSGNTRPGSPASGGGGGAGKDYDFTEEQIADSEFYLANRDKIEKAYAAGRVRQKQRR